jgi:predicted O-methyltransferase YrrM
MSYPLVRDFSERFNWLLWSTQDGRTITYTSPFPTATKTSCTLQQTFKIGAHVLFEEVAAALDGIPYTKPDKGRIFYEFVLENAPQEILELGFAHGVSTCYMAAALDEIGSGRIFTIDKLNAADRDPDVNMLSIRLGLSKYIEPVFAPTSFTWEMRRMLAESDKPRFDFVFQDGGHTWDVAGFSFFLIDRLLRPGGWVVFDDLKWTLESSSLASKPRVRDLPDDERKAAQVGDVFDLLVRRHPDYLENHTNHGGTLGWARKRQEAGF